MMSCSVYQVVLHSGTRPLINAAWRPLKSTPKELPSSQPSSHASKKCGRDSPVDRPIWRLYKVTMCFVSNQHPVSDAASRFQGERSRKRHSFETCICRNSGLDSLAECDNGYRQSVQHYEDLCRFPNLHIIST